MNLKRLSVMVSILSFIAPVFMLRAYLGYFDNAGLLTADIANAGILNGVFIFISLSVTAFSVVIFLPSVAYGVMVPKENRHMWNYETIKSRAGISMVFNAVYSSLLFFYMAYLSSEYKAYGRLTAWVALMGLISGVTLINYLFLRDPVNQVVYYKDKKTRIKIKSLCFLAYPAGGVFMILLNCYGLVLLINSVNHEKVTDSFSDFVRMASVMIFLCVINIVPGIVFSLLHNRTTFVKAACTAMVSAVIALSLLASVVTSVVPLIINRTMTFTGIADWKVRRYVIDGSSFPEKRFSENVWYTEQSGIKDKFIVKGVMVYSLNNTRLLCPEMIKPVYRDRIHFVPWSSHYDSDIAKELEKASVACQPFTAGGINRLADIE
ncbi:hypothetical protein QMZ30_11475 [Pantoea sp. EA-12]|uniref:hypothetical protein n=1 Tax=Pantoea sp. EA-12 TaxID=3043303 RepID=UPI0024B5A322|nr:hypothetical protein [Pantoea sp. EA-12]MDI9221522.1 hypothetical protein [Pantoea sp. EA-12]